MRRNVQIARQPMMGDGGDRVKESDEHQDVRQEVMGFHDRSGEDESRAQGEAIWKGRTHPARDRAQTRGNAGDGNGQDKRVEHGMGKLGRVFGKHAEARLLDAGSTRRPSARRAAPPGRNGQQAGFVVQPVRVGSSTSGNRPCTGRAARRRRSAA
ncbi:MAG: hypothetical protein U1E81_20080 [Xanthobacteraceae bacterium]